LPDEEEQRPPDGISTSDESALALRDQGVSADRTGAGLDVTDRDVDERRPRGVETPTTITATATPQQQFVGHGVTIAGQLTSGGGADLVALSIVLYNTDYPSNKVRTATTTTDAA